MIDQVGSACCGCGACANACPRGCIKMEKDQEGFYSPVLNEAECVHCGLCQKVCPQLGSESRNNEDIKETWASISGNETILRESSSGGLFTELAKLVLSEGGLVYGAAFEEDYHSVHHICVDNLEELKYLRGSKYLQSKTGNVYSEIKSALTEGRKVLFSGTPCQVAGLRKYLGKEYTELLLVDVICHGIPSPELWNEHLSSLEEKNESKAGFVNFRHKERGWNEYGMYISFKNGKEYFKVLREEPYMKLFLLNCALKESCYQCRTKENGSFADITIGDFWGVENVEQDLNTKLGVSLALIHTEKGKEFFKRLPKNMVIKKTDYEKAVSYNTSVYLASKRPAERDRFYQDQKALSWDKLQKKYLGDKTPFVRRVLRKVKRMLFKIIGR